MVNWIEDDFGNRKFTDQGWEIKIWGSGSFEGKVDIMSPTFSGTSHEVEMEGEGIWVNGVSSGTYEDNPSAFTIPWSVIDAIIEARKIVSRMRNID
jgi:hypothetical protein